MPTQNPWAWALMGVGVGAQCWSLMSSTNGKQIQNWVVATFLIIFGAYILTFAIKVKSLVLIKWSYISPHHPTTPQPAILLTIEREIQSSETNIFWAGA